MKLVIVLILGAALAGCGSGARMVATDETTETEAWYPAPGADLAFESRLGETYRPEGDLLTLMCRVGADVVNRGSGSGSAAVRLGVGLADGTELTKTFVVDLGSGDREHVEALFDLTDREDEIRGPLKYIHLFLDKPK